MKVARFWTRDYAEAVRPNGKRIRVRARGWSDESLEAASRVARDAAQRIAGAIATGQAKGRQYLYGDRPLPEPIVRQMNNGAVVTRNSYGALVLNTQNLMFIDIDQEDQPAQWQPAPGIVSSLLSLFRGPANAPPPTPSSSTVVDGIGHIARQNGLSVRVYKTAAGYRGLVTNRGFEPASPEAEALLRQFGADNLYIRLCRMQESFRARLTPKPWRCQLGRPAFTYPYTTPVEEERAAQWVRRYAEVAPRYATCRFVTAVGAEEIAPEFRELVAYHDAETRTAEPALPLA